MAKKQRYAVFHGEFENEQKKGKKFFDLPERKEICSNLVFCVNLGLLTLCFLVSQLKGQTLQNESAKRQTLKVLQISLPMISFG